MNSAFLNRGTADNDAFVDEAAFPAGLDLDFAWVKAAIYRSRWILIGGAILGIVVGLTAALLSTRIYTATSTLQIESQAPAVLGNNADATNTTAEASGKDYLQTQVVILASRTLLERVARSLNYVKDPRFFDQLEIDQPDAAPGTPAYVRAVVSALSSGLEIKATEDTRLVTVSFSGPDPKQAQDIANELGKQFIQSTLERRFSTTDYSRRFLQQQIEQTRQQLEQSERALIEFAQASGITSVGKGGEASATTGSLTDANLASLNNAYAKARADRTLAEQRWNSTSQGPLTSIPEVIGNSTVQSLQTQRAAKEAELQGELQRHVEEYPSVQQLRAQIASIDSMIDTVSRRVKSSIQEQYGIARSQEAGLARSVAALRSASLNEQSRGVQLSILRRDADTNRALYDALLQRYREINATSGVTINNISVIDPAELPYVPVWPKPIFNVLIGLIAGVIFGILIAILRERLNDTIRSPDEIEQKFGIPLVGLLPMVKGEDVSQGVLDPKSSFSEAVYSIRTALQLATTHGIPRSLAFTSTQEGEGKSTTAMAVAREMAHSGTRTLLIDADLRRPSLHRIFQFDNAAGFSNYLTGQAETAALIRHTDVSGLDVMTSGPVPVSAPRLLAPTALAPALEALAREYDLIILDCPPVLGLADALQLATAAEGTIYIHEVGKASQHQTRSSLRRLVRGGASLIGVILTKFDFERDGYAAYGYSQYYYSYASADK